jgi:hypothetical protein
MKPPMESHWILREIAEQTAPAGKVNLWQRIETHVSGSSQADRVLAGRRWVAVGLSGILLLAGVLFFVPSVRAAVDGIVQRMGIFFVDTRTFGQDSQVSVAEVQPVTLTPPSGLSLAEIRSRANFPLRLPTWLPGEFAYVHADIGTDKQADGQETAPQQVTIEYRRAAEPSSDSGVLLFEASNGRIGGPLLAETKEQAVSVNGSTGIYVHGGWQSDGRGDPNVHIGSLRWDDQADAAYLTWTEAGVTYLLSAADLGLQREDLLRIAQSLRLP